MRRSRESMADPALASSSLRISNVGVSGLGTAAPSPGCADGFDVIGAARRDAETKGDSNLFIVPLHEVEEEQPRASFGPCPVGVEAQIVADKTQIKQIISGEAAVRRFARTPLSG